MKIPKWEPRAQQGQCLGFSLEHSSLVGIVRNLSTEFISPQFHIVLDEQFTTVHSTLQDTPEQMPWIDIF
jgi:hypothetical protein